MQATIITTTTANSYNLISKYGCSHTHGMSMFEARSLMTRVTHFCIVHGKKNIKSFHIQYRQSKNCYIDYRFIFGWTKSSFFIHVEVINFRRKNTRLPSVITDVEFIVHVVAFEWFALNLPVFSREMNRIPWAR